jgi:hypothetical protein
MALFDVPTVDSITRGDYEEIRFELHQPDSTDPQNITGWTLRCSAKFDLSDAEAIFTKSSDEVEEIRVDNASLGIGHIVIQPTDLETAITYETTLICDLEAVDPDGKKFTTRFKMPVDLDVTT